MTNRAFAAEKAASGSSRVPLFHRARRSSVPAFVMFFLPLILAGCISEEREIEIGNGMAEAINPNLPLIDDPLLNAYVYSVGQRLGAASERPDLTYRFYIVDSPIVNAFAIPGGHIYLTRGLIDATTSGGEFASILAHEIGHVAARHGVQKLQRHLRTGALVNVLYETILGGEPDLLRENSLQLATFVWSARHSRRDEREADRLAVEYLARSGVDPHAVVSLLETLLKEERQETGGTVQITDWFSTHPLTQDRIEAARDHIEDVEIEQGQISQGDLNAFAAFKLLLAFRMGSSAAELTEW